MRRFIISLAVPIALEVASIAAFFLDVATTSLLSFSSIALLICVVGFPLILGVGLWQRFRRNQLRRAAVAFVSANRPGSIVFSAEPTSQFMAEINLVRYFSSGARPAANNRMPFIVTFSETFMTIDMIGKKPSARGVVLPLSMVSYVAVEGVKHPVPGADNSPLQTLRVSFRNAPWRDLFIPVQLHDLKSTSRDEVLDLAAAVSKKTGLSNNDR